MEQLRAAADWQLERAYAKVRAQSRSSPKRSVVIAACTLFWRNFSGVFPILSTEVARERLNVRR